jgi:hypothetical protein
MGVEIRGLFPEHGIDPCPQRPTRLVAPPRISLSYQESVAARTVQSYSLESRLAHAKVLRPISMLTARSLHPSLQRLVVLALVACSFVCCCQQWAFGAGVDHDERDVRSCCGACRVDDDAAPATDEAQPSRGKSSDDRGHPARKCLGACCTKADFKPPHFTVAADDIGAPIADIVAAVEPVTDALEGAPRADEGESGAPPPRLRLLISARLRI